MSSPVVNTTCLTGPPEGAREYLPIPFCLSDVTLHVTVHQFSFQHIGQFYNRFVVAFAGILCFGGENRNSVVNAVVQRKLVVSQVEIPADRIKIVLFVDKIDLEVIAQNVGNLVKPFEAAIVIDYGFGTT